MLVYVYLCWFSLKFGENEYVSNFLSVFEINHDDCWLKYLKKHIDLSEIRENKWNTLKDSPF